MNRKCHDFINDLNDYIDGEIEPGLCEELERHIGQCDKCRIMVDTLRQTVKLCCEGKEVELPTHLKTSLNDLLREKWKKKFGRS
jgi:anti-sigma factor RsiW